MSDVKLDDDIVKGHAHLAKYTKGFYDALRDEGFGDGQSIELTKAYIGWMAEVRAYEIRKERRRKGMA